MADAEAVRGLLNAYVELTRSVRPALHADMASRALSWRRMSARELSAELERLLAATSQPGSAVGLFWKLGTGLTYRGANEDFLATAGVSSLDALVGRDDFDARLPWGERAARFRVEDRRVLHTGRTLLYVERPALGSEHWRRIGKTPVRAAGAAGVVGLVESVHPELGRKLYSRQAGRAHALL